MFAIGKLYGTTVGKKFVVALTGAFLFVFVIGHMAGNLKTFAGIHDGVYKVDHYAEFLRTIGQDFLGHGGFLWLFRIALLAAVGLHIVTVLQLRKLNADARPVDYDSYKRGASSFASRTMMFGGLFILTFIVVHLLHLTFGTLHTGNFVEGKVYANVYQAFSGVFYTVFYLLAMFFLGLHLYHGLWSVFQTLGLNSPSCNAKIKIGAAVFAVVVGAGFALVPIAIFLGLIPPPIN